MHVRLTHEILRIMGHNFVITDIHKNNDQIHRKYQEQSSLCLEVLKRAATGRKIHKK